MLRHEVQPHHDDSGASLSASNLMITGATGFLGGAVLSRLAARRIPRLLIQGRSGADGSLHQRVERRLRSAGLASPPEWSFLEADLLDEGDGAQRALADFHPEIVLHAAADTSIAGGWHCDRVNRVGTLTLLRSLRRLDPPPLFVYVSTAFVCGVRSGRMLSEEAGRAAPEEPHLSLYARSKADAERLVEQSEIPHLVLRPSIIVGSVVGARAGWIPQLARAAAVLGEAPVRPDAGLDIVTVEHVADAILALLERRPKGLRVCNITAGERSLRCADLVRIAAIERRRPDPLRLTPPEQWDRRAFEESATQEERRALLRIAPLLPFLNLDVTFSDARCAQAAGLRSPTPDALEHVIRSLLAEGER